ncbi:MAG: hypothetical protein BWY70_00388 [Bacteroidetes bacterium ADurb.Bin408]|nr:MAG: hypothetical protein BWY70_00388 [Bacteroidetes bacterium ADurb.Bin408]
MVETKDNKNITVDIDNNVYEVTVKKPSFKIHNHKIILFHESVYQLYSLTGSKIMAGKATAFYAPAQAGVYLLLIENKAFKINISP